MVEMVDLENFPTVHVFSVSYQVSEMESLKASNKELKLLKCRLSQLFPTLSILKSANPTAVNVLNQSTLQLLLQARTEPSLSLEQSVLLKPLNSLNLHQLLRTHNQERKRTQSA